MPEAFRPATMRAVKRGAQFAHQSDRNGRTHLPLLPPLRQGARQLQRHHSAAEKSGQHHNEQTAHADAVHLQDDVVRIVGLAADVAECSPGE